MSDLTPSGIPPIPEPSPYQPPSGSLIPPGPGSDLILTPNDKNMGMLCHLLAFSGLIIPFGHVIGPLIIWLMQKDKSAFTDYHGKESVNFQISVTIAFLCCLPLILLFGLGFLLMLVVGVYWLVMTIVAALKASDGGRYQYPISLRFIK